MPNQAIWLQLEIENSPFHLQDTKSLAAYYLYNGISLFDSIAQWSSQKSGCRP